MSGEGDLKSPSTTWLVCEVVLNGLTSLSMVSCCWMRSSIVSPPKSSFTGTCTARHREQEETAHQTADFAVTTPHHTTLPVFHHVDIREIKGYRHTVPATCNMYSSALAI